MSSANLLLIFEAAGRLNSFSRAAREMSISQPAVSHGIKNLELQLGTALFERQHRGVRLNKIGSVFYTQVSRSLNEIYQAADEIKHQHNATHVTLSVSTAFATHWL
ncbi:MAG: LysR family transcriptional regulator, partial [Methylococcales bacterium]|nr:LysR family transcriptional regulator [Methylococcales bacterium]